MAPEADLTGVPTAAAAAHYWPHSHPNGMLRGGRTPHPTPKWPPGARRCLDTSYWGGQGLTGTGVESLLPQGCLGTRGMATSPCCTSDEVQDCTAGPQDRNLGMSPPRQPPPPQPSPKPPVHRCSKHGEQRWSPRPQSRGSGNGPSTTGQPPTTGKKPQKRGNHKK